MATLWTTYDPLGQSVAFTEEAWDHILYEHPDLREYHGAIRRTVENPYVVTKELDGSLNYYGRHVVPAALGRYLNVLLRRSSFADLEVRTAWPTDAVDEYEERLW